jgi:hypothetical protein
MRDAITLTNEQIKTQLVMYHKVLSMVGCKGQFKLTDGQYTGIVDHIQFREFSFTHTNETNEKVSQPFYVPTAFILTNDVFIDFRQLVEFMPLT